jgi:UbiD family decarboxylase
MHAVTSLSAAMEEARAHDDLLTITRETNPHLEVAAIARTTDAGPMVVFDQLRGYPGHRIVTNVFSDRQRIARWCGIDAIDLPRRLADAALNPVPSRIVSEGASQAHVTTSGIDLFKALPLAQQTQADAGCVITGGLALVRDPDTGAFNGSYHRMRVLGPDHTCITIQAGRHLLEIARKLRARGERRIPISVNIGAGPAVLLACSGSTQQTLTPLGYDELGMAGALQGQAVEVVPCRSQEGAWSLAEAEYVLEGYIDTDRLVSEEDSGKDGEKGMMPEAGGYMGRAWRVWQFNVTAITHRTNPVYWFPLARPPTSWRCRLRPRCSTPAAASARASSTTATCCRPCAAAWAWSSASGARASATRVCRTTWRSARCRRIPTWAGSSRWTTTST